MGVPEYSDQQHLPSDCYATPAPPPYEPSQSYSNEPGSSSSSNVPRTVIIPAVTLPSPPSPPPPPPPESTPSSSACPQSYSATDHAQYLQAAEEPYKARRRIASSIKGLARNINHRALPGASIVTSARSEYDGLVDSATSQYEDISRRLSTLRSLTGGQKPHEDGEDISQKEGERSRSRGRSRSKGSCRSGGSGSSSNEEKEKQKAELFGNLTMETYVSKLALYGNAKVAPNLPPFDLDVPSWSLVCLAAHFSQSVYEPPKGREQQTQILADWRPGVKPMHMKSVPLDNTNTIVFAIRGTTTMMDWANNIKEKPTSPEGFLDDTGNLCHGGFLAIARKMIKVVFDQLRQMLAAHPARSTYNIVFTGHSAGGAIAALLYIHTLAQAAEAESELNTLAGYFKRVHCITFGAPPVSLVPLLKPERPELHESLFLSFLNEGDPVARGETVYLKSLLEFFASPAPGTASSRSRSRSTSQLSKEGHEDDEKKRATTAAELAVPVPLPAPLPIWKVPTAVLCNAGNIVVMRSREPGTLPSSSGGRKTVTDLLAEGVTAATCREDQLRGVLFGDPMCHTMGLYAGRIEALAKGAWAAERAAAMASVWGVPGEDSRREEEAEAEAEREK